VAKAWIGQPLIGHHANGTEGSAKNPPKGKVLNGIFCIAGVLRGFRAKTRDTQGY
jgi:hypothetical protein